jgi:uncharacterized membrane protein (DUF485 family)
MSSSDVLKSPYEMPNKKMAVWAALTSFFLMWTFLTIVLIVFRPAWVCCGREVGCDSVVVERDCKRNAELDYGRAFVVALIITLVVMLIVWLVAATAGASR